MLLFFLAGHHLFQLIFVLLAENASSLLSLGDEVVARGQIIEPIFLQVGLALVQIDVVVLLEQLHDLGVDRDLVPPNKDTNFLIGRHLIVPGMSSDVLDGESLSGVRIQDAVDQVLGLLGEE